MARGRRGIHPKYNQEIVESVMLKIAAERTPSHFTEDELIGEIVADPEDEREIDTARRALGGLREFDLATPREDGIVELTPAALRAAALLCE